MIKFIAILFFFVVISFISKAQNLEEKKNQSLNKNESIEVNEEDTKINASEIELESLYDDNEKVEETLEVKTEKNDSKNIEIIDLPEEKEVEKKISNEKIEKLSDLVKLAPFSDLAIISKKYLPKTKRFEISPVTMVSLNNPFFDNLGLGLGIGYSFNENYGVEFDYNFMTDIEKGITKNLKKNQNVSTRSLVVPKNFISLLFKWSPVYGKMAWFQKSIIPFEIYFTPGLGLSQTEEGSEFAFQIGTGQLFSLSRSMAVRWDLNWKFYNATVVDKIEGVEQKFDKFHNDFVLQVGMSFFFPGVRAR